MSGASAARKTAARLIFVKQLLYGGIGRYYIRIELNTIFAPASGCPAGKDQTVFGNRKADFAGFHMSAKDRRDGQLQHI